MSYHRDLPNARVIKIKQDNKGNWLPNEKRVWHYVGSANCPDRVLCTGEKVISLVKLSGGETIQTRIAKRYGVTCPDCIAIMLEIKKHTIPKHQAE